MNDEVYYRLTRKSGDVYKKNSFGRFEDKARAYKNGIKIFEGNFSDGKEDGMFLRYFDNGLVKRKEFYKNGIKTGLEHRYLADGSLIYRGLWKDGKWYGSQLYYSEKGIIQTYCSRDFRDNPNDFFYIFYNTLLQLEIFLGLKQDLCEKAIFCLCTRCKRAGAFLPWSKRKSRKYMDEN